MRGARSASERFWRLRRARSSSKDPKNGDEYRRKRPSLFPYYQWSALADNPSDEHQQVPRIEYSRLSGRPVRPALSQNPGEGYHRPFAGETPMRRWTFGETLRLIVLT